MAFAQSLPKRDARYDAFRAKLSILQILVARGYDIGDEVDMIDGKNTLRQGYEIFSAELDRESVEETRRTNALDEVRITLPADVSYKHEQGIISPLTVMFLPSTLVNSRVNFLMERIRPNARRSATTYHYLFVVDKPREVSRADVELLGNNTLEILPYQRLLFNPTHHYRAPSSMQILDATETATLLSAPGVVDRTLPILLPIDPITLFLDVRPGEVCRIGDTRLYTGQNASYINYRQAPRGIMCVGEGCTQPVYAFRSRYCAECNS
ncbi:Hypothetical protein POVR2_LOCUS20 [uncultured virus]|nr:Hypothetical protein POVR2_LOCUS20 [uncultured virus]